jgi:hypothetical protein
MSRHVRQEAHVEHRSDLVVPRESPPDPASQVPSSLLEVVELVGPGFGGQNVHPAPQDSLRLFSITDTAIRRSTSREVE